MTLEQARALDAADPLSFARARFALPDGVIYLDGNSLGALPRAAPAAIADLVERQWGNDLITSWNKHDWIEAPATLGARLAPLIGASASEVLVCDSTSVNLFKLLVAALGAQASLPLVERAGRGQRASARSKTLESHTKESFATQTRRASHLPPPQGGRETAAQPGRRVILTERDNFPTDLYVAQGIARLLPGVEIRAVDRGELVGALDHRVAVLMLTQVDYRSGERHDMAALSAGARKAGALSLWDLSHSAGAIDIQLNACGADLAVGCGYKYLNGGPGAPAFLYVATALQDQLHSPLSGWMGHDAPFAFDGEYRPAHGIARFLAGTPPVVAMTALAAGLATFDETTMHAVEAKSAALTDFFIACTEQLCPTLALASPREAARRGSHVSFRHPDAYAVMQALIAGGVIGDVRMPDLIRFGFAPLYNTFEEAFRAAALLGEILDKASWNDRRFQQRAKVI